MKLEKAFELNKNELKLDLDKVLFDDGDKNEYHAFINNKCDVLICHECDDGIDYTIYNNRGVSLDGGQFDYNDELYTVKDLLLFADFYGVDELDNADEFAELAETVDQAVTDFRVMLIKLGY